MPEVTVELKFCYGHRLLDYNGKCSRLHGHNGKLEVTFRRQTLDAQGFVVDFAEAKKLINELLDTRYDHYMLLQVGDPVIELLGGTEVFRVTPFKPTAENLAQEIFSSLRHEAMEDRFGFGVKISRVRLWETDNASAIAE